LNDLYIFAQVVVHNGYSSASRDLGLPKSTLSRRIAALEERLGSRLVQRSSRTFAVTAAGQLFLKHCLAMIAEADAAELAVAQTQTRPRGLVRVSCPISMAQSMLGPILPAYLSENPEVNVSLVSTNRSVNLIEEGFDVALFIHRTPLQDSSLIVRSDRQQSSGPGRKPAALRTHTPPQLSRGVEQSSDHFHELRIGQ